MNKNTKLDDLSKYCTESHKILEKKQRNGMVTFQYDIISNLQEMQKYSFLW